MRTNIRSIQISIVELPLGSARAACLLRYAPMNTSSFCDKNLGLRTSAHSAIWWQRARKSVRDEDGDRRSTIERRVVCVLRRRLLFAPFAIYLYRCVCFYQLFHYRHSHTHRHTGTHSLGTHTHSHAARSGRGKANEFTQKKLHNALSDTFTKLARFFFFCFSAMHTGHNSSDNNNKYCVYFCCRATDTFNVAHKTHHTCCMWNIFPRVSKNEPSFIFSLLLVGLLHKGRGKEAHAPRRVQQATATTTTTAATAFAFVIVAFAFVFSLLSRFAFRVAFLLIQWILELCLNIGFIIKYNSHYHRGLLCLFYFCCFVVCSFCCFSCCNCITRLKARTFWVNSHSTQSGTHTHTHCNCKILFILRFSSKQNPQPKKCIKKTETEEIQKKTSDPRHWHTHRHTYRHMNTNTGTEITSLLRRSLTPHRTPQATANEDVQCSTDSRGMRHDPLTSCCCLCLALVEWNSQPVVSVWERVCVSVCGCAASAECDRVRSRASCMAWLSLTRRQLGTAIVSSDLWINVKFLMHFVDSTNICKVLGFKQIK